MVLLPLAMQNSVKRYIWAWVAAHPQTDVMTSQRNLCLQPAEMH